MVSLICKPTAGFKPIAGYQTCTIQEVAKKNIFSENTVYSRFRQVFLRVTA